MIKFPHKSLSKSGLIYECFYAGEIYLCDDDSIAYPDEKLAQTRKTHKKRPVLVLGDNAHISDDTIGIIPLSHLTEKKGEHDHVIKKESASGLTKDSLVQVDLFLPVLKHHLTKPAIAKIDNDQLQEIIGRFLNYHGFLE